VGVQYPSAPILNDSLAQQSAKFGRTDYSTHLICATLNCMIRTSWDAIKTKHYRLAIFIQN